jgi:hypothetical protein
MRNLHRFAEPLAVGLLLAAIYGCASLGLGIDEKPQGVKERFIAAMVDYEILAREAAIMIDGWAVAVEQGDPLTSTYIEAANRISQLRTQARSAINTGLTALSQTPPLTSDMEAATRALNAVLLELQRELLAGRAT